MDKEKEGAKVYLFVFKFHFISFIVSVFKLSESLLYFLDVTGIFDLTSYLWCLDLLSSLKILAI